MGAAGADTLDGWPAGFAAGGAAWNRSSGSYRNATAWYSGSGSRADSQLWELHGIVAQGATTRDRGSGSRMTSQLWELHCTDTSVAQGAGVIAQGAGATRNSGSGSRTASQLWELHGNGAQGADATRDRSSGSCMYGLVAQGAAVTGVTCTSMSRGTPVCIRGNPGELCCASGGNVVVYPGETLFSFACHGAWCFILIRVYEAGGMSEHGMFSVCFLPLIRICMDFCVDSGSDLRCESLP